MGQKSTVLFVEDDPLVRVTLGYFLPEDEFKTLVAESALEALRMLAEHHVDVLVTDLVMPGANGLDLAAQAKLLRPDLRIMFMSGYFSQAVQAEKVGPVMFKPILPREMESAIRQYLQLSRTPQDREPSAET
ncbi:MAG TPA: response regulator [Alphaproteobacteria bacterium]|nr:response regulator [Alphaproteobacteria bacterium]